MQAILRDGSILSIGDEVTTDFTKHCIGLTFVIESIEPCENGCESGCFVVAALKDDPSRKILGLKKEGYIFQDGIDANWYKKK